MLFKDFIIFTDFFISFFLQKKKIKTKEKSKKKLQQQQKQQMEVNKV